MFNARFQYKANCLEGGEEEERFNAFANIRYAQCAMENTKIRFLVWGRTRFGQYAEWNSSSASRELLAFQCIIDGLRSFRSVRIPPHSNPIDPKATAPTVTILIRLARLRYVPLALFTSTNHCLPHKFSP